MFKKNKTQVKNVPDIFKDVITGLENGIPIINVPKSRN